MTSRSGRRFTSDTAYGCPAFFGWTKHIFQETEVDATQHLSDLQVTATKYRIVLLDLNPYIFGLS
jgi:hypothetical protein